MEKALGKVENMKAKVVKAEQPRLKVAAKLFNQPWEQLPPELNNFRNNCRQNCNCGSEPGTVLKHASRFSGGIWVYGS